MIIRHKRILYEISSREVDYTERPVRSQTSRYTGRASATAPTRDPTRAKTTAGSHPTHVQTERNIAADHSDYGRCDIISEAYTISIVQGEFCSIETTGTDKHPTTSPNSF
ncbi:hypothetical protein Trisim1_006166 [Trichoderma cf. simile WF8]